MVTVADSIDDAWALAEAALPQGDGTWSGGRWVIHAVSHRPGLSESERWEASAWGYRNGQRLYCYGSNPARALRELASKLREIDAR